MRYRTLGATGFRVSEIGLGGEYLEGRTPSEVCSVVDAAMEGGINLLDCFMSEPNVRTNLGLALRGRREKMQIQGHFRSIWADGQYGRTLDIALIRTYFEDLLRRLQTDYIDIGMIHMIDNEQEYEALFHGPVMEYVQRLRQDGVIHSIGVSCHNPVTAMKAVKTGFVDVLMFSINPAYDVLPADAPRPRSLDSRFFDNVDSLNGLDPTRMELYRCCESRNVGLTVMKSLAAGALLREETSPFGKALTVQQCMHYALTRPGVSSVLVGMQTPEQVADCLRYEEMDAQELDYAFLFAKSPKFTMEGRCMYCNHCLPCTQHINIAQVNKYLDMAELHGVTPTLRGHYEALEHRAGECVGCEVCQSQCPFQVKIVERMRRAEELFGS